MSTPHVMVLSPLTPATLSTLEAHCVVLRGDKASDRTAYLAEMGQACRAVVIKGHDRFGPSELRLLPKLEIVACTSAGIEAIDHEALLQAGITLTNASEALKDEVADTALMLILAARKELVKCDGYVRTGAWGEKGAYPLLSSIRGKRVGILGFGAIGQEIAERLKPMKVEIGYCTRRPKESALPYFATAQSLADWCDILVVAIPGGTQTDGLVSRDVMARLGPNGTLINIARGSVVDETALVDLLSSGKLGSAGLDVFQNEPHPTPALTALTNVILYPHHASGTVETRGAMAQLAVDNVIAHFQNAPLLSTVARPNHADRVLK